ncbi:MAG: 50S ribosomal protein L32 [Chloroflexota bacterium]|nr:50S ribosomal protein L32 [Dehalococcoidia bacterium]MDW8253628.1 50S ribosomal protein L32 [Chloroflexota bacterium]
MAVPKKKTPRSYKLSRRSHHHLTKPQLQPCPQCRQPMLSHRACPHCGTYNGREVIPEKAQLPDSR